MEQSIRKIKEFFSTLTFEEESHLYYVGKKKLKLSVSGVIKKLVAPVDFDQISKAIDFKQGLPLGTTKTFWKNKSDLACSKGNKAHYFGELYMFHRNLKPTDKMEEAVVHFWNSLPDHIVPAFAELQMYHKTKMFGGTADIILYNLKSNKFIIADYKTNEDLHKNFKGKKLLAPFDDLLEKAFSKYELQFSLYQILLEQVEGIEVENRALVWLLPDGTSKTYFTPNHTERLREFLKDVEI